MRMRKDNRGSSLIVVIIVIAFVSLLISTLFMMSVLNIQMKGVDRESKESFYSAEGALEQITVGLQKDLAGASAKAYVLVMQEYANKTLEVERRQLFNNTLLASLKSDLKEDGVGDIYKVERLKGYLSDDLATYVDVDSPTKQIVTGTDSLVLKDLEVTFTDASGYQSIIETDIRLTAPNLNFIQPSDMPDLFDYSIIANKQLTASAGGTVNIEAGVYAGDGGLNLTSGAVWNFKNANRIIVNGEVDIPQMASLVTLTNMDLWAKEINVKGGSLTSIGRTYVSNDLTMSNRGSHVTLGGEYYGYGNGEQLLDNGITLAQGGDSSAILINGVNTTLDMSTVRRLLLSGSAQIATGDVEFEPDKIESMLPENEPSLNDQLDEAAISSGTYYFTSTGNGLIVCAAENYLVARTAGDKTPGTGSWELLGIVLNPDNTISLRDLYCNKNKYVSVNTGDQNILAATADEITVYEKFYPYVYTEGRTNYYALKSCANGKFVSIDTYYSATEGSVVGVLCANRDKVSDMAQLFLLKHYGSLPMIEEEVKIEPTIAFTYEGSQISIEMGHNEWGAKVPSKETAWISYVVKRNGSTVASRQGDELNRDGSGRRLYYNIRNLRTGDIIEYTIMYTKNGNENDTDSVRGTYTHRPGYGNTPSDKVQMVDGIYFIRCTAFTVDDYFKWEKDIATIKCETSNASESDGSWEEFILVNNHDGTISFKSIMRTNCYLSVQENGVLMADESAVEIGINEKFILESVEGDDDQYRIRTVEGDGSNGNGKYLYVNRDKVINSAVGNNYMCVAKDTNNIREYKNRSYFSFNWLRVTSEVGTQPEKVIPEEPTNYTPITSMEYKDEESAAVSFSSAYWTAGNAGTVKLYYTKNLSPLYPEITMNVSGTTATAVVNQLKNQDKVTYYFTYDYVDASGVRRTATTPSYIYVHETKYGEAVNVSGVNENVNLGESLEVKSNQIAYLVPPECIGVFEGETIIGKNPMSDKEFTQMMAYVNNTSKYPGFEMVSFTKTVEGLGKSLAYYRSEGTDGYRTIFVPTSSGTMVYFYVDFDSNKTSEYFRDYYSKNQSMLQTYMKNYVNEIRLSNLFTRLTTNGNMVYSASGSSGRIDLHSNEGSGANLTEVELSGLRNEEEGYQKRFKALSSKLMMDYDELSSLEKTRPLFDNLIRYSEDGLDVANNAFAGVFGTVSTNAMSYSADNSMALVVHNTGIGPFVYDSEKDPNKKVCLILASGDVVVKQDFKGIIIARGTVTIDGSKVSSVTSNQEALFKVLQCEITRPDGTMTTFLEHFFRDGDKYVLNSSGSSLSEDDYVTYAELVTYEDWTKK